MPSGSVTGAWARQRKAEEREASRVARRRDGSIRSRLITIREAAWSLMAQAYLKASTGGTLPAHARQIMYAAPARPRPTGRRSTTNIHPAALAQLHERDPSATAEWDVVFDVAAIPEPHTGRVGPRHPRSEEDLRAVTAHPPPEPKVDSGSGDRPHCGPDHRFGAILFVEKEGFCPSSGRCISPSATTSHHVDERAVGHR